MIAHAGDRRRANVNDGSRKAYRRSGNEDRRRLRLRVLARDGWRCQFCGIDLARDVDTLLTSTVDHLLPQCEGGGSTEDNLIASCVTCNGLKAGLSGLTVATAKRVVARRRAEVIGKMLAELIDLGIPIPASVLPMTAEATGWSTEADAPEVILTD